MRRKTIFLALTFLLLAGAAFAAPPAAVSRHYAVILAEPSTLQRFPGRVEMTKAASEPYRQHLLSVQRGLKTEIAARHIRVTGAATHVMNAIFVKATAEQAAQLRAMPGVKYVVPLHRFYMKDQLTLTNVNPAAWNKVGGEQNAGKGIKIAVIDSGIDETHPSFQDSSLTEPPGFPKCDIQSDCDFFTTNKVIVARSYVFMLSDLSDPTMSRPDDYSPLDRVGHGTAVASVAAGVKTTYAGNTVEGVAPKAFLGNYKVFGSPEVNDFTTGDTVIAALDDAVADGMDIAVLSLGAPAFGGPLDSGATCGLPAGQHCDAEAQAVETAVQNGQILVVAAAGNEGADGYRANNGGGPTFGTIDSPGSAPSAISVGGTTNDQTFSQRLKVSNAPSNLQLLQAFESADGPLPPGPPNLLTAQLIDVTRLGDNGKLCGGVAGGSLNNAIALVLRGDCDFSVKVINAQNAGAVGVVIYDNGNGIVNPAGLGSTDIPAYMISQTDGQNLKTFIDANPNTNVTLDPTPLTIQTSQFNTIASFSSRGPSTGLDALKPDIAAVGTDFVLAAQYFDPLGILYSGNRYATGDGTSFATPMVAGAAALVKQNNPSLKPLDIKSALVNTARPGVLANPNNSGPASVLEMGGGLLTADNAIGTNLTVTPSSVSFGLLNNTPQPAPQTLTFKNIGTTALSLTLQLQQPSNLSGASVQIDKTTFTLQPNATQAVTASLSGTVSIPGRYVGNINVTGASVAFHIPVFFLAGDGVAYDMIPLAGQGFDGTVGEDILQSNGPLAFRLVDQFGAPVSNQSFTFAATKGGGSVVSVDPSNSMTDINGIATAEVKLGPTPGDQAFTATVGGLSVEFDGIARAVPAINVNGIVDGATFAQKAPVAPGSIISIFGTGLADFTGEPGYTPLPISLGDAVVSFDVPNADPSKIISLPAPFFYAGDLQLNVQVPWELEGQSSVIVKVRVQDSFSATYTLPLTQYQPSFFVYHQGGNTLAAAQDVKFGYVTPSSPIPRGQTVILYLNGLGPTTNEPATGDVGPDGSSGFPFAVTTTNPTLTIGGQQVTPQFAGLAPGLVGLYQINATVPSNIGSGLQPMTVTIGGVTSPTVMLPVQ